ncbi:putative 1-phosphatidylinositol-3-phosphate 5-kinase FAB1D [Bienertia sinuspersici]
MCRFCSKSNEQMEPNDNDLSGRTREEPVDSATSQAVNNEQKTVQKDALNGAEAPFFNPSTSLSSSESFASNCSEYSVDVNPYGDGHSREVGGAFDGAQEDPRYRLYNAFDSSHVLTENQKQGKNGFPDDSSSSDESFDEADEPSRTMYERDEIWVPPEAENKNDDEENSMTNMDDDDDDEAVNGDSSEWEMPRLKDRKIESKKVKDGKFKDLVSQLLRKLGVEISDAKEENWVDIVTDLAWKAAKYLEPGIPEGKAIDPAGCVKIKCVAAGSRSESRLIKGLVFKKHAAHKHMITKYQNPKLLLIQGMLGPSSGSSGLSSLSSMMGEDENCKGLIKNLQACQPNVILVEKSASRAVMENILQMGITLVLDMKPDRLERVARCTGSLIVSSETTFTHKLRHCASLYFEKFVEEHAIVGEGGKKPSKTLMFLEGCPTNLGCTILLKGSHAEDLKKIKCVVQCAVVMAHHFLLETSFLVDQKAMFSTIAAENAADILPINEQSSSAASENSGIPDSGEHNVGDSSADGVHVHISNSVDQDSPYVQEENSCNVKELTTTEEQPCHDIVVSNGLQEEKPCHVKELTVKDAKMTSPNGFPDKDSHKMQLVAGSPSKVCCDPHFTTVSASSRSLSHALANVSIVSPDIYREMSTYIELNGKEPEAQTAVALPVLPTEDPAEHCDIEAKNKFQSLSTSSAAEGEAKGPADDGEESIRAKDEISSVLDSESILVLMSSRNASKGTICEQSHFTHIKFYRNFDVPLGKFLRDNLFNQALKCEACGELPETHYYFYAHHSKQLTIRVKRLADKKPLPRESDGKLWMWSRCSKCEPDMGKATKRVLISTAARCLSFGKFLELSFSSHSSFNRLASCGHSFQKDFLYFFGLGSMVAMFQYSRVAIHTISLPPHKMEFSSSLDKDWLEPETRNVYTTGLVLFNELEKYLKKIESRFSGWNLILNGYSKGFSDIIDLLKLERSEFEENFKKKNEDSDDSACNLLTLNRLRWEILLEACVWDRRLQSLLSSSSTLPQSSDDVGQRKMGLKDGVIPGEEAKGSKTEAEPVRNQMEDNQSVSEGDETQKIDDKAIIKQVDSEKENINGAVEATAQVMVSVTGSNIEGAGELGAQRANDVSRNVMIEIKESNSHGDDRSSGNCNDVGVRIEMVAEGENLSVKEPPHDGSLPGHGEEDFRRLPIVEENTHRAASWDSIPSVSLSQESNGSTHLPSHLRSDGESAQQDNVLSSGHLSEDRCISTRTDEDISNCSADGEVSERKTSPLLKLDSSLWNPFGQIREECMEDLLEGRPPKFVICPNLNCSILLTSYLWYLK